MMARVPDQNISCLVSYRASLPNPLPLREVPDDILAKVDKPQKTKKKKFGSEIPAEITTPSRKRQKLIMKKKLVSKKTRLVDDTSDAEATESDRPTTPIRSPSPQQTQADIFSHVLENPIQDTIITPTPPSSQPDVSSQQPLPTQQTEPVIPPEVIIEKQSEVVLSEVQSEHV